MRGTHQPEEQKSQGLSSGELLELSMADEKKWPFQSAIVELINVHKWMLEEEGSPAVSGRVFLRAERSPRAINPSFCITNGWAIPLHGQWRVCGLKSCPRSLEASSVIKQTVWKNACSVPVLLSSQLQSPAEPELLLRYRDGSQHGLCEPAVTDLGGEPGAFHWESGCGCGAEWNTPGGTRNKIEVV